MGYQKQSGGFGTFMGLDPILNHLGLCKEDAPVRSRAPPPTQDVVERIIDPYDDGLPDYEEPYVDVQSL